MKSSYFLVNCQWAAWGSWQSCSVTCGGGTKQRTRTKSILAQNGGLDCNGDHQESQFCGTDICPVDCVLSEWKNITSCSKSCGGGLQLEQKHILVPHNNNGKKCPNIPPTKTTTCNTHPCPGIHILSINKMKFFLMNVVTCQPHQLIIWKISI